MTKDITLNGKCKKVLNKNDSFDELIIELAETGVLDVGFVEIKQESSIPETYEYSQKTASLYLKKQKQ